MKAIKNKTYYGICWAVCMLSLFSCDKKAFFDHYYKFENGWSKDEKVAFEFEQSDTLGRYNLFLNVRNNNDYPFSNLFVIVKIAQPNGKILVDTLEYEMANPDGTLMGTGFSDVKENKLWLKENFRFPSQGKYEITLEQALREMGAVDRIEKLKGISEVGIRIENIQ